MSDISTRHRREPLPATGDRLQVTRSCSAAMAARPPTATNTSRTRCAEAGCHSGRRPRHPAWRADEDDAETDAAGRRPAVPRHADRRNRTLRCVRRNPAAGGPQGRKHFGALRRHGVGTRPPRRVAGAGAARNRRCTGSRRRTAAGALSAAQRRLVLRLQHPRSGRARQRGPRAHGAAGRRRRRPVWPGRARRRSGSRVHRAGPGGDRSGQRRRLRRRPQHPCPRQAAFPLPSSRMYFLRWPPPAP